MKGGDVECIASMESRGLEQEWVFQPVLNAPT